MGRKGEKERKRRKAERSILWGKTFEVMFHETIREEGGREISTLLELLIPLQSYEFSHHC